MLEEPGTYILKIFNTENNCTNYDTVRVSQNANPPEGAVLSTTNPSCNGDTNGGIHITNVIGGSAPFSYSLNLNTPNPNPQFENLPASEYLLTITDDLSCTWDSLIVLDDPAELIVHIQPSKDKLVTGEEVSLSIETNIPNEEVERIIWFPESLSSCLFCLEIITAFNESSRVEVNITDVRGCTGVATLDLQVDLASVPSAITPNGDGNNDYFIIPVIEQDPNALPHNELIIFNRWGDVIFRAAPYLNDWDGKTNSGKKLPEGTYYYVFRPDIIDGGAMKGDLTILR